MLERTITSLLGGGVKAIVVVVGPDATRLRAEVPSLRDARVRVVVNPDPSPGMFSSLQAGLHGASGDPVLVLPGDMPFVRRDTVAMLVAEYGRIHAIVSPRFAGKRGHPVILPPDVAAEIVAGAPTSNLHVVLHAHPDRRVDVDVDDRGVVRDVDVMGDLAG